MDFETISIDQNHAELIYSLMICKKPKSTLEIGIGSGLITTKIINAYRYNNLPLNVDCVDNFYDWNGIIPDHIKAIDGINLISLSEEKFTYTCDKQYDFIISDADHFNAHKWIKQTCSLLNNSGILIYHDITNNMFPNLATILDYFNQNKMTYSSLLFNKSTLPIERCHRGLLIVQKIAE
jgi:predicted O-methyltransferase YrrM